MGKTFAHIVNPYTAPAGSDAHRVQSVTLSSLRNAVKHKAPVSVELLSTSFPEEAAIEGFTPTLPLTRSVLDLHGFPKDKRLPLLSDILQRAYETSKAEYIVYTNMDIIVQPYFYAAIEQLLRDGVDALVINRRRIADTGQTAEDLPVILAEVGRSHPGFDCFVMHRSLIPKLLLDGLCIGVPFVEAGLLYNLLAFAQNCRICTDLHLTTHLGLDVMPPRDPAYHRYNQECFNRILPQLKPLLVGKQLPYSELGFLHRTLKRALNPAIFTGLHLELEGKGLLQRITAYWNEVRFRILAP